MDLVWHFCVLPLLYLYNDYLIEYSELHVPSFWYPLKIPPPIGKQSPLPIFIKKNYVFMAEKWRDKRYRAYDISSMSGMSVAGCLLKKLYLNGQCFLIYAPPLIMASTCEIIHFFIL